MTRAFFPLAIVLVVATACILYIRHIEQTRPQDLPWTPLDLRAPIGTFTRIKLQRLSADPGGCRDALLRAGVRFQPIVDRSLGPFCGYRDAIFLERSAIAYAPQPLRLSCPLAAALVVWERQVVEPQAERLLGARVRRIDHLGSFSCRRLYGRNAGPWSEHATAGALDIAGFALADGRQVVVTDWTNGGPRAAFVHAVHAGACTLFGTTLGPDYNAAHAGHLHLDMKGWAACR